MKKSVAIAKEADAKKGFSTARSKKSTHRTQNESERQLGSLRSAITNIRRDDGTLLVESIAAQLSGMPTTQRVPVLLGLQEAHGNRYVQRVVARIQAMLVVGQPGDKYEQEADRVAEAVMRMPEPEVQRQVEQEEEEEMLQAKPLADQITPLVQVQRQEEPEEEEETLQAKPLAEEITPLVQRQVGPEEEEEELQAKATSGRIFEVNSNLESHILSFKGGGQPLPESVRAYFEPRFGHDFSQMQVHADTRAAESVRAVNARAYTVGQDVVFGVGQYAPETTPGGRLLAHELTHVVQQGMSSSAVKIQRVIEGGITQMSITEDWARKLNDAELKEQIEIVRDQLPSLNSGSPEFETLSSNLQILEQVVYNREAEVRPIIEYILKEMLNNAASTDVRRMHELNSVTMEGCIQEWQDLPLLGQLLGPGPEECVDRVFAAKLAAMVVWAMNVRQGGSWDHKPHIGSTWGYWHRIGEYDYDYDIWSNIHYGYVGTAAGFSESALLDGAGAEQIGSTLARFQWPRANEDVKGLRAFDSSSDRASISIGIRLYETGATFQSILIAVLGNDVLSRRPVNP